MPRQFRNKFFRNNNESAELGFGSKATDNQRLLNKDGTFNIMRIGQSWFDGFSIYHWLVSVSWIGFVAIIVSGYFVMNLIFATIYFALGAGQFAGLDGGNGLSTFAEMFFFSTQTFTTVGYGRVNPLGFGVNFVASVESLTGLLFFALATGLLYGRFSRPVAHFLFSDNILVAPFKDIAGLMFRVANKHNHQLVDIEARVNFSIVQNINGANMRRFYFLELELSKVNFFPTSWTVNHPITDKSPLYGLTLDDLKDGDAEFLVLIKAFDENFSQTVNIRYSYKYHEMVFGAKFMTMMEQPRGEMQVMNMEMINAYEKVPLPVAELN